MIFVTVGTHEQPFNRLIKKVDDLVADGTIQEKVVMQTGFSTYKPKHCEAHKMMSFDEMQKNIKKPRIHCGTVDSGLQKVGAGEGNLTPVFSLGS